MSTHTHTPVTSTYRTAEEVREEHTYCAECGDLLAVAYVDTFDAAAYAHSLSFA